MGITSDLTLALQRSIEANGLDKTRILISKMLERYSNESDSTYCCNYCSGEMSQSFTDNNGVAIYSCDSCDNEIVEYQGTVRTKRRSARRRSYWVTVTIRCFNTDKTERVIECYFRRPWSEPSAVTDIEMKSGDKFLITFFRVNNNELGIEAAIENTTIQKEASAFIGYDDLCKFAEYLPLSDNSYLKKLPDGIGQKI